MTSFKLELQNDQPVVDLRIPPQYLRFLRLRSQTSIGFEIAEFRVFGTGFVPEAQYISNVYDLVPTGRVGQDPLDRGEPGARRDGAGPHFDARPGTTIRRWNSPAPVPAVR